MLLFIVFVFELVDELHVGELELLEHFEVLDQEVEQVVSVLRPEVDHGDGERFLPQLFLHLVEVLEEAPLQHGNGEGDAQRVGVPDHNHVFPF